MALSAGVGNFVFVSHAGSDDLEGVSADVNAGKSRLNFWHVAGNAVAGGVAGAAGSTGKVRESAVVELAGFVVSVLFESGGVRPIERHGAVAIEAELIGGFA